MSSNGTFNDPRLPGAVESTFAWLRSGLATVSSTQAWRDRLSPLVDRAQGKAAGALAFPPSVLGAALAGDRYGRVAAASTAFYIASTLMDEVLAGDPTEGWTIPETVSGSQTFLFAAQELLAGLGNPERTTKALKILACRGGWISGGSAAGVKVSSERKSAEAFACYAEMAAVAGDLPPESCKAVRKWGEAVGLARHVRHADVERAQRLVSEASKHLDGPFFPWGARALLEGLAEMSQRTPVDGPPLD